MIGVDSLRHLRHCEAEHQKATRRVALRGIRQANLQRFDQIIFYPGLDCRSRLEKTQQFRRGLISSMVEAAR